MKSLFCKAGSVICLFVITLFFCNNSVVMAVENAGGLNKSIGVSVYSTLTELNEFRPGYLYLTTENRSDTTLDIDSIVIAERPSFICIKLSAAKPDKDTISYKQSVLPYNYNIPLSAHESRVYPLYVRSTGQVKPGEHMLQFNIFFKRSVNGKHQSGSVLAEHKFKVKVFGENEILGALSNTVTFLIFPGIIIIVLAGLSWNTFVPTPWKEKLPEYLQGTSITDVRFWVISITLSLFMVCIFYPVLTKRDYLYGYGFLDIVWMWLISVVFGVMISIVVALAVWSWQKYIQLKETDVPLKMLRKMVRNGINTIELHTVTIKDSKEKGFLIETENQATKECMIIPFIEVLWQQDADKLIDEFDKKVNGDSPSTLRSILETIDKGLNQKKERTGLISVSWLKNEGFIQEPKKIERANIDVGVVTECVMRSGIE